ncbi:nuclear migration protein [Coccidioides immitis RS]|uniref:Nuclear migration protein n=1 Tax=Coccidioides immitis (strain RS) TaxID=246410 RepID=A0A0E1RYH0_COCIM|nr:nuclear migration protein [Coccidioides immitis RS]EAS35582.2 nuclear migration protein [Coccidioides immitis RS]
MATNWESERDYFSQDPSSPSDSFYKTPPASISRHSLHRRDSSPGPSSSPAPFPSGRRDAESRGNIHLVNDDTISPLDPRRFTPTLHASLVSEILSLRRDLESKTKEIDTLELSLENARTEAESLQETVSKNAQETRSLKRQLQLLEGGSNSAITDLAKERDEALENISDVRKRLEVSQKKVRAQEEQIEQTQLLWNQDKQKWDEERRNLDRKVHVVEGRLKLVLSEIAAAEAFNANRPENEEDLDGYRRDGAITRDSDAATVRSSSAAGRHRRSTASIGNDGDLQNFRYSIMSQVNGHASKAGALNLADELAFDEEHENTSYSTEDERPESRDTLPEENYIPNQSHPLDLKARRILGLSLDAPEMLVQRSLATNDVMDDDAKTISGNMRFEYKDMGIQYTPPPSPKLIPDKPPVVFQSCGTQTEETDTVEKDQDPKNATIPRETVDQGTTTTPVVMIASSCQTIEEVKPQAEIPSGEVSTTPETASASTQTDDVEIKEAVQPRLQMPIPIITVHPPGSNPPSPRSSVVLPPQTKSAASQTDSELPSNTRCSGMQTEEIRVDKRTLNLRTGLLPSAMPDKPLSSDMSDVSSSLPVSPYFPPPPKSPRRKLRNPPPVESPPRITKTQHFDTYQAYPGNNDNGPLTEDEHSDIRRPFRSSSLFAGFGDMSDEETQQKRQELFSDDELLNRPMASYTLKSGKLVSKNSPNILNDNPEKIHDGQYSPRESIDREVKLHRSATRRKSNAKRPARAQLKQASTFKEPDMRRAAMISSSTAAHQSFRPRSPSAPSIGSSGTQNPALPPFPVPVRFSSRKPRGSSEGAQSPTPYRNGNMSDRMGDGFIRKTRSAAVVARTQPNGYQSPPTISTSSVAPDSPQYPPMPLDEITAQTKKSLQKRTNRQPSSSAHSHSPGDSNATNVQPTSVVDAIAQTMIGGWMWKYVRRRKSFGMPENSKDGWEAGKSPEEAAAAAANTGVRHKRWVWLAPYERAIMWSSKQPTSGPALLGKSGRKLVIQSVLDVKDENPLPKGASPQNQVNRSILILTPQRALKFTAMTIELHFIWLTALSFLSHSSMAMTDLAALPPVPQEEYTPRQPTAALRRNPIRDSIRVAKGKSRSNGKSKRSFAVQQAAVPEVPHIEGYGDEPVADAADPPYVPRFSSHTRKRSNTAPRPVPNAFRSFSNHTTAAASTYSATTAGSSDLQSPSSIGPPGIHSGQSSFSHRTSEASGPINAGTPNFFDAVGTVRMEAFVDRSEVSRQRGYRNRYYGKKRNPVYWPQSPDTDFPRSDDGSDIFFRHDDPFKGF